MLLLQLMKAAGRETEEVNETLTSFFESALVPFLSKVRYHVEDLNEEDAPVAATVNIEIPEARITLEKLEEFITLAIVDPQVCDFSCKLSLYHHLHILLPRLVPDN